MMFDVGERERRARDEERGHEGGGEFSDRAEQLLERQRKHQESHVADEFGRDRNAEQALIGDEALNNLRRRVAVENQPGGVVQAEYASRDADGVQDTGKSGATVKRAIARAACTSSLTRSSSFELPRILPLAPCDEDAS